MGCLVKNQNGRVPSIALQLTAAVFAAGKFKAAIADKRVVFTGSESINHILAGHASSVPPDGVRLRKKVIFIEALKDVSCVTMPCCCAKGRSSFRISMPSM